MHICFSTANDFMALNKRPRIEKKVVPRGAAVSSRKDDRSNGQGDDEETDGLNSPLKVHINETPDP